MIKKIITVFLSITIFFASPNSARALSLEIATHSAGQNREKIEGLKQIIQNRREEIKFRIEEHRASVSAGLTNQKKQRIRHFFQLLTKRLEAAVARLETLISRIESRLEKIETQEEDIDTTSIREELEKIKANLDTAKADLETAKTSLETILESDQPKNAFQDVKELIKEIKQQLITIHRDLVYLIGDIKGLRIGQENNND
jgi:HPt (histidine-containing phosphotransfer) domain-containing protein